MRITVGKWPQSLYAVAEKFVGNLAGANGRRGIQMFVLPGGEEGALAEDLEVPKGRNFVPARQVLRRIQKRVESETEDQTESKPIMDRMTTSLSAIE